ERLGMKAESLCCDQEGLFVQARCRDRRQAAYIGLADRPADLLGDIEKRTHQRIDRVASVAVPDRGLEPAILHRGHAPSAPRRLVSTPLTLAETYAVSNV